MNFLNFVNSDIRCSADAAAQRHDPAGDEHHGPAAVGRAAAPERHHPGLQHLHPQRRAQRHRRPPGAQPDATNPGLLG